MPLKRVPRIIRRMEPLKELHLEGQDTLIAGDRRYACAIGRGGVSAHKKEGDLATPAGSFPLRLCYYRPDRVKPPQTALEAVPLFPNDGWCDDPKSPLYNTAVKLPFAAHHEKLWRQDPLYDLIIPLGYNDAPIVAGLGSAIFLHVRREDGVGTEGCIALAKRDLLALLPQLSPATTLTIPALA